MKKIIYLVLALLLTRMPSQAQVSFQDHIDLGPTSADLQGVSTPGEWGVTHGTPSYSSAGTLWMWNARVIYQNQYQTLGEGVFRRVNFTPGATYAVHIGIPGFNAAVFTNAKFSVLLCNDPIPPNACGTIGCPIPTFASSRLLYTYAGGSITDQNLHLRFATQANESYQYIVIYPGTNNNTTSIDLTISCLGVFGCASADMSYCGVIPGGELYWRNVSIGSSFCSSSGEATTTPNTTTNIKGGSTIVVGPRSNLSVSSGNPLTMSISPCPTVIQPVPPGETVVAYTPNACAILRPSGDQEDPGLVPDHISNDLSAGTTTDNELSLYPNPTKDGQLILHAGNSSIDGKVYVQNVAGQTLRSISINGVHPRINISDLPSGVYFIKVISSNKVYTGRVVKQ